MPVVSPSRPAPVAVSREAALRGEFCEEKPPCAAVSGGAVPPEGEAEHRSRLPPVCGERSSRPHCLQGSVASRTNPPAGDGREEPPGRPGREGDAEVPAASVLPRQRPPPTPGFVLV